MVAWFLFVLLFGTPLLAGAVPRQPKCKNPKGKLWSTLLDKDCGQSVCTKKGNKGVWEQCPRPATQDKLEEMERTMLSALAKLEEKIEEQCGYQAPTEEKPLLYKILRCNSSFVQVGYECEYAFDGDITTLISPSNPVPLGWAYGGRIPSSVIFYLDGSVSVNTFIFRTGFNRTNRHLNDFAIDVLVDNVFKPVDITRVNVENSNIDGNRVQTNNEKNIRVAFNTMNQVSAIKLHAYGADLDDENSVVSEVYVLLLKDKNLLWFWDDVDAILNTAVKF